MPVMKDNYETYREILRGRQFPLAWVNLDALDENIRTIVERAGDKSIRIASKSIRSPWVMDYILKSHSQYQGIMAFTASEAVYLSRKGFDDLLVAYPVVDEAEIQSVAQEIAAGKYISLMADCKAHIEMLEKIGAEQDVIIPVCIDIDMSVDFPGLHFGVWRSPIRNTDKLNTLLKDIKGKKHIRLDGLMGYEAQIAGVTDAVPGKWMMNHVIRFLKNKSVKAIATNRQKAVDLINSMGFSLKFVNGGGTGSLESTIQESCVTEVTVGSGFFQSHLFDNYQSFKHRPASGFACAINRIPKKHIFACSGGGYIASGSVEKLKLPMPWLPTSAKLLSNEGAGEVQTPVEYHSDVILNVGDPVIFRHSKAGELCERFNSLLLIRNGKIVNEVPTYRGEGKCFL